MPIPPTWLVGLQQQVLSGSKFNATISCHLRDYYNKCQAGCQALFYHFRTFFTSVPWFFHFSRRFENFLFSFDGKSLFNIYKRQNCKKLKNFIMNRQGLAGLARLNLMMARISINVLFYPCFAENFKLLETKRKKSAIVICSIRPKTPTNK